MDNGQIFIPMALLFDFIRLAQWSLSGVCRSILWCCSKLLQAKLPKDTPLVHFVYTCSYIADVDFSLLGCAWNENEDSCINPLEVNIQYIQYIVGYACIHTVLYKWGCEDQSEARAV